MTGPVATSVFPLAVNPGTTAHLEVRGPGEDRPRSIELPVPKDVKPGEHFFALSHGGGGTLPVPLVVTTLPVSAETADTPAAGDPPRPAKLPAALCGRLGERGDTDGYRFEARKGVIYAFEAVARRAGSECDPVLRVLDAKGSIVTEADDTRGNGQGCANRVESSGGRPLCAPGGGPARPGRGGVRLRAPGRGGQPRLHAHLRPRPDQRRPRRPRAGLRSGHAAQRFRGRGRAWAGRACRRESSASPLAIGPAMTEGVIVVSAAPEAKHAAALVASRGPARVRAGPIVRRATPLEEIYLPGGGRGHYPVETLALAVTDPSDITVEATPREVVLAPENRPRST